MTQGTASLPEADFQAFDGTFLEALEGGRLFLTGGTGFFGSWLLEYLYRKDRHRSLRLDVEVLSRDPEAFLRANPHYSRWASLHMREGDVRGLAPGSVSADWILHGATPATRNLQAYGPMDMMDIIVKGTEAVLAAQRDCKRFLFISSGLACGTQPPEMEAMAEEGMGLLDSMDPRAAYGNAKHFAEHLCLQAGRSGGFDVLVARCYAFAGPLLPLDSHFAFGNFIRDGLAGSPIRIQGDGTPLRTYLHAAELAHWLWRILVRGRAGAAVNVGGGEPVSIRALAEHIGSRCGVPVEVALSPRPGALPARYVPSIARAEKELGLVPRIDWREAVDRTLAWHRAARAEGEA